MNKTATVDAIARHLRAAGATVHPLQAAPWIDEAERKLGFAFPRTYRALVTRYAFSPVDVGAVTLFANRGDGDRDDLAERLFRDAALSTWLLPRRLLQIGSPATGRYDPVCLDPGASSAAEPAIVQLDHEDILLQRSKVRRRVLAENLLALVASTPQD